MLLEELKALLDIKIKKINLKELEQMVEHFEKGAPATYAKNHFELAHETGLAYTKWEEFLSLAEVATHIDEQLGLVNAAAAKKAMLDLGTASSSIDVQKSKQFLEMQKQKQTQDFKPFNVYMLPKEALKYKRALLKVRITINEAMKKGIEVDLHELLAYIDEAIPPKREDIKDAISQTPTGTA